MVNPVGSERPTTLNRITQVLDFFIERPGDAGVTEISQALGFGKSATHRIVAALTDAGYLATDTDSRRYRLGYRALQLGLVSLSQVEIRQLALPRLRHLRDVTRETVNLGIRVNDHRVYIESLESPQEIRQRVELGREMSLLQGASSKAILAHMERDDQERILARIPKEQSGTTRSLSEDELRADLVAIAIRGYAVSQSERLMGAFSVAVPVFDHNDDVIASVSISGPTQRWRNDLGERYGELLMAEIGLLSRDLGSQKSERWREVSAYSGS